MSIWELILIGISLSMDAFAVSMCKGLATKKYVLRAGVIVGLWFGIFQGLMPFLGYLCGSAFEQYITAVDHWIAFLLLAIIGGKMIWDSCSSEEEEEDASLRVGLMLTLAIATSIDAFAVGITFALLPAVNIFLAIALIGVTTFVLSVVGVALGHRFGQGKGKIATRIGGIVLVLRGLTILLEHLGLFALYSM